MIRAPDPHDGKNKDAYDDNQIKSKPNTGKSERYKNKALPNELKYFLLISIIGTFFLLLMAGGLASEKSMYPWQKTIIFISFILICFLGALATLFPQSCVKIFQKDGSTASTSASENNKSRTTKFKFEGHHPSCENFENHVFHVKKKAYCAGCSGLLIGAVLSIIGTLIYLYGHLNGFKNFGEYFGEFIFILGIIIVVVTLYFPLFWKIENSLFKFTFNVLFVLGAFIGLIGLDIINKNFGLELYYLVLIFIWILFRISISKQNHWKICNKCDLKECSLKFT